MSATLPFVGREALRSAVCEHLAAGRHVVLQGPAGVGKTRLAAEVLRDPRWVTGPVDRLLANESLAGVLLGALAPLGPPTSVAADGQGALFGWFLRRWRARSTAESRALVWVEDIHHCDPLSEAILRQAVDSGVVQLLATHRSSEALGSAVQALVTQGLLLPVPVQPLGRPAADHLARSVASRTLDPATLGRIDELAAGNPLFVRELAAGTTSGVDLRASTTLTEVIGRPLRALSPAARRVLEVVALAEPAPEELLSSRWQQVRELEDRGLVVRRGGTVLVDHPLRRAWVRRDIGSARLEVLADLVDLVEASSCREEVDVTQLIEWQLQAAREPDADELERATRLAIARRDGAVAMRFASAVRGPVGALLRGHALITVGRLQEGLDLLAEATTDGPASVRAEAAFTLAGYAALMQGDFARAHAALDLVNDDDIPTELRRYVTGGRLWLWIFGPIGDTGALQRARKTALNGPDDLIAFELSHSVAAALHQVTSDPRDVEPLLARCAELKTVPGLSSPAIARWQAVRGSWMLSQGDAEGARGTLRAALVSAEAEHDLEGVALLAGNISWLLACMGRLHEAMDVGDMLVSVPPTDDWYSFRTLGDLVYRGNVLLAQDRHHPGPSALTREPRPGADIARLFVTRREMLCHEVSAGDSDDDALLATLGLLVGNRKHLWAALFGLEVTSLTTRRAVHELLWRSSRQVEGPGMVAVGGTAARARLDGDGLGLLRCGQDLEWAGLHGLAMRVYADATSLLPATASPGRRARAGVLRALRVYDGRYPHWLPALHEVPTPRQMEVAWKVVSGASVTSVADELFLSGRTVENHLQRVYRALRVHGREELTELLSAPAPPPGWRPGNA